MTMALIDLNDETQRIAMSSYLTALERVKYFGTRLLENDDPEDVEYLASRLTYWRDVRDSDEKLVKAFTQMNRA